MTTFSQTERNRVKRLPNRGHYDTETIYQIVDDALICHVAFEMDGQPYIIPTLHARRDNDILLHGASTSRMLQHAAAGHPLCLTITHVDGLVLARSVFHHSINYRSAILFGTGRLVEDPAEKMAALRDFTERLLPGRWDDVRPPNPVELKATAVIAVAIDSASAKVRTGPPGDDAEDMSRPTWAGVVPVHTHYGRPEPDPQLDPQTALPDYLSAWLNGRS